MTHSITAGDEQSRKKVGYSRRERYSLRVGLLVLGFDIAPTRHVGLTRQQEQMEVLFHWDFNF